MNTTQRLIIALMKAAVTGESQPLPQGYSLEEAMPIIKKQGLATLAYEGGVLCGISRNDPNMQILFKLYYQILLHSERQMQKVEEIYKAFEENGIDYLPFKGCVLKALYPKPELRPMGDADILIRAEQYVQIDPIMKKMGFVLTDVAETVLTWESKALVLELHRNLYGPSDNDLYDYYGEGWQYAIKKKNYQYCFSPEDTYLHLFTHFVKHYRSGGIGSRHVLDLWVFRNINSNLNEEYIDQELKKLHLLEFHRNIIRLVNCWFMTTEEDNVIDFMTEWIFSSGIFGTTKASEIFKTLREMENEPQRKNARLQYYRRILFPGLRQMKVKYPVLERCPYLLPLGWFVRGVVVLLSKRQKLDKTIRIGMRISDQELRERKKTLEFVGLRFHE